ncbi:hypothetical protein EKO23_16175 [Nocardioides guangzhouensis]|uniref:Uncharacterized protein n=1 Tax=Nocardioides guangzhouensis TaxID=2497878 RepID=A0A4V1XYT5_9ACTN|nr:hypothetical protein [Nocardioides guangzhouensis]RYP84369.1 hypothetical protein EKO23_16175 [Nocardioides guangzhouensis]
MDGKWLARQLRETGRDNNPDSPSVCEMLALLMNRAEVFAARRPDVVSPAIVMPRRGLRHDESTSFLRAVAAGIALVDEAGYVTLPTVRQKAPIGRYALFSKSGTGVSVNLEYVIQIGATAELILDHGWPSQQAGFEMGEFDAVTYDPAGRVVLAMEAKARTVGSDSLEKLVRAWMRFAADPAADTNNNAGRKWRELTRLCRDRPVVVWLVADGARWILTAHAGGDGRPVLSPGGSPDRPTLTNTPPALKASAYDAALHRPTSFAGQGGC